MVARWGTAVRIGESLSQFVVEGRIVQGPIWCGPLQGFAYHVAGLDGGAEQLSGNCGDFTPLLFKCAGTRQGGGRTNTLELMRG